MPWDEPTGPRSAEGKAQAARNGDKGGPWQAERENLRQMRREFTELMWQQRELLARVRG